MVSHTWISETFLYAEHMGASPKRMNCKLKWTDRGTCNQAPHCMGVHLLQSNKGGCCL